ncbi:MAG: ESPR-type extended signal peptide-containing protein [Acidaminococcus sp.]|uniref:ESPR-type extended signal peptide-containing protein n=1 Tax=Acidaminococcus sp. TaxID=1872103 RepID=UPI003F152FE5
MNKIYKVIYSKVRNCYVVVSELAKNNSKGTSRGAVVGSRKGTSLLAAVLAAGVLSLGTFGTALAAGSIAIENGAGSKADGIGSIAVGVGDKVVSSTNEANRYQGATSLAVGTLNIVDADASAPFDGVASSVVGQVNYTKNANAAIIMGAGNKVTNSYQAVSGLDQDTINQIMGYYQKGQMDKVTELLQKAVPNSGGQVLAIGGGNTVDYAQASQVMGVSNTLKGTKDSISKYNLVDGFQNNVTGAQNTYVVGTKNTLSNTQNTITLGDNRTLNGVKGAVVIGSADAALTTKNSDVTILGNNANATVDGGVALGSGSIASTKAGVAGYDALKKTHTTADKDYAAWNATDAAVSVGGADREVTYKDDKGNEQKQTIKSTRQITNLAAGTNDTDAVNVAQLKASETNINNTIDRKVAVVFDDRGSLKSTDANVDHSHEIGYNITNVSKGIALGHNAISRTEGGKKADAMLFGAKTYTAGIAIGENSYVLEDSIDLGNKIYTGAMGDVADLTKYNKTTSTGTGRVLIGNNSYSSGSLSTLIGDHSIMTTSYLNGAKGFFPQLYSAQNAGAVSIGALNSIESYSSSSTMSGVANDIIGLANKTRNSNGALILGAGNEINNSIAFMSIDGSSSMDVATAAQKIRDTMAKGNYAGGATLAIGGGNKADYTQNSQLMGVGNSLTGTSKSISKFNMLDGYKNTATNVSNTKIIGSNNTVNDKADSNTIIGDKHVVAAEKTNNVIIGNADQELTTSTSDAVLIGHNADVKVDGGVALGSGSVAAVDKGVAGYDPSTKATSTSTDAAWKATDAAVSVGKADGTMTRQITGVAAGTNDTDAVNVAQLKRVNTAVEANKVHYYSVKSKYQDKTSNYNNDGAKADESMVIGIGSSSEALYSTVIGMDNTVKKWGTTKASGMYDTVVGQYLNTNGSYNSVFGTYYEGLKGSEHVKVLTEVYGDRNTVLGVGNQVGNKNHKSDENTVIGVKNQVEGNGSIVVGNATTVHGQDVMNGTSFGHVNTIYDKNEGGGQWGVALGNNLTVKGEYALAAGNESTAQGYDAVAIGHSAVTSGDYSVAMGSGSSAAAQATAIGGTGAKATANHSVALGSFSVADRDAGEKVGYDPSTQKASTETSSTWKSKLGAVSVGDATNGYTRQITNVAAGSEDTDAVNVAQLKKAVAGAKDGNDTLVSNDNALSLNGKQLSMNIKDTAGNTVSGSVDLSKIAAAADTNTTYTLDGKDNGDNTTTISLKDNDGNASGTVTVATKDTRNTVEAGENVTLDTKDNADGSHVYKVNVKADGKVEAGDTKLVSGDTVYNETRVQQDGTYVKQSNTAGQNLSALDNQVANNSSSINRLNGRVNDLDSRINKVGAGAAALAALHPQDFNPDDKWDFAVGYGNYRDANAMAIGAFYRPDENVMFSMGTNFGNGENMINAGVTFKLGPKNHTTSNKYLLSKEVTTLRATVAQQDAQLKQQSNEIKELREMVSKLMEKTK